MEKRNCSPECYFYLTSKDCTILTFSGTIEFVGNPSSVYCKARWLHYPISMRLGRFCLRMQNCSQFVVTLAWMRTASAILPNAPNWTSALCVRNGERFKQLIWLRENGMDDYVKPIVVVRRVGHRCVVCIRWHLLPHQNGGGGSLPVGGWQTPTLPKYPHTRISLSEYKTCKTRTADEQQHVQDTDAPCDLLTLHENLDTELSDSLHRVGLFFMKEIYTVINLASQQLHWILLAAIKEASKSQTCPQTEQSSLLSINLFFHSKSLNILRLAELWI